MMEFKMVPVKATEDMITKGQLVDHSDTYYVGECAEEVWKTMLEASPNTWLSAECAPKDGREILVLADGKMHVAKWSKHFLWQIYCQGPNILCLMDGVVTHWMPLPQSPKD